MNGKLKEKETEILVNRRTISRTYVLYFKSNAFPIRTSDVGFKRPIANNNIALTRPEHQGFILLLLFKKKKIVPSIYIKKRI